jgi:hypothetical protein
MLASRTWDSGEDYCHRPLGLLESLIFTIVFIFLLVIFFSISFVTLSRVSINEYTTISGCVITVWVPYAVHVFKIIKLPGFGKLLFFVCYSHDVVGPAFPILMLIALMFLSVRVVPVVSI